MNLDKITWIRYGISVVIIPYIGVTCTNNFERGFVDHLLDSAIIRCL